MLSAIGKIPSCVSQALFSVIQESRNLHSYLIWHFNRYQNPAIPLVLLSQMGKTMCLKISKIIQLKEEKMLQAKQLEPGDCRLR